MKKYFKVSLLTILALIGLTSCMSKPTETIEKEIFSFDESTAIHDISSEDGKAHIDVSNDSLPNDITKKNLKINKFSEDENSISYRLEPDGTKFKKPITVSIELEGFKQAEGTIFPLVSLISDEQEEPLNNINIISDPQSESITIQAQVPHFSYIKIKKDTMMEIVLTSPSGKFPIGSTVPVEGYIKRARQDSDLSNFKARVFMREVPDKKILSPVGLVKTISTPQDLQYNEQLDFYSNEYKCNKLGKTNIKVLLPVRFDIGSSYPGFLYKFYIYTDRIECFSTTSAEGEGEEEGEKIKVIQYKEHHIPIDQIHATIGTECDKEEHWHPNTEIIKSLKNKELKDPNPNSCGFGKTKEVPIIEVNKHK